MRRQQKAFEVGIKKTKIKQITRTNSYGLYNMCPV